MNDKTTFCNLSLAQKYEYLTQQVKYIAFREYYNYFINLYLVEDVFYELWFFKPTHEIEKIELLKNQKTLDLYINYMNQLDAKMVTWIFPLDVDII